MTSGMWNEPPVVPHHHQESLKLLDGLRRLLVPDDADPFLERLHTGGVYAIAEEVEGGHP